MKTSRIAIAAAIPVLALLTACGGSSSVSPESASPQTSAATASAPMAANKDTMAGFDKIEKQLSKLVDPLNRANDSFAGHCSASTLHSSKCRKSVDQLSKIATLISLQILTDSIDGLPDGYRCRAQKIYDLSVEIADSADAYLKQSGNSDLELKVFLATAGLQAIKLASTLEDWRLGTDEMLGYTCD